MVLLSLKDSTSAYVSWCVRMSNSECSCDEVKISGVAVGGVEPLFRLACWPRPSTFGMVLAAGMSLRGDLSPLVLGQERCRFTGEIKASTDFVGSNSVLWLNVNASFGWRASPEVAVTSTVAV